MLLLLLLQAPLAKTLSPASPFTLQTGELLLLLRWLLLLLGQVLLVLLLHRQLSTDGMQYLQ